ncbi:hypothetical protein GLOTRDRAFT_134223 [Gloeophyllum trabeum ATCC 11539]|uniref:Uncharacterized protein n=1 Tax=Gloeophyllum trabeum (strain ATCC 11539 / FP-39264 / Madison 617) TaxID=670483 RepID=S7R6X6_GLOTA|nr:uncharacterized protein GLOTRDRAFT_134223 [Gloeophyllum trabeum ATCC 11539]EPQ50140.1 hypothetical protein GLOTRDRAFT_134223 [Gloeophyllum trabeum ATCC 11539]
MSIETDMPPDAISKKSILVNFICSILLRSAPDAVPICEAKYILPRDPTCPYHPLSKFTRKAAVADLIETAPVSEGSRDSLPNQAPAPQTWEPWELDIPGRMERFFDEGEEEESDGDSMPVRQNPLLNRHLLSTPVPSDEVFLPFLCVSEQDSIFDLLSSALYQRVGCGFKTPLVGLTYHYGSPAVQLLVAWLEDEDTDTSNGRLPAVHVACEGSSGLGTPHSLFNLCDPLDALRLASLLICLPKCVSSLRELGAGDSSQLNVEPLPWRSDFYPIEDGCDNSNDYVAKIAVWAKGVADAIDPVER